MTRVTLALSCVALIISTAQSRTAAKDPGPDEKPAASLDARLDDLTAVLHHNFARDGLADGQFIAWQGERAEHVAVNKDGLLMKRPGTDGYAQFWIAPRLKVHGDFDIVAEFQRLRTGPAGGPSGISLMTVFEDRVTTHGSVYRGFIPARDGTAAEQITQAEFTRIVPAGPQRTFHGSSKEPATSGRLRLARRGGKLFCLFAAEDSPEFRLLHVGAVPKDAVRLDGLRLLAATHGKAGSTEVLWKEFTIRAERISDVPPSNPRRFLLELARDREKLARTFRHDFTRDNPDDGRFRRWGNVTEWKPNDDGLTLVAPGADNWTASGLTLQRGLRGDFDVYVDFNTPVFDQPIAGQNSAIYLRITFFKPAQLAIAAEVIFVMNSDGRREVVAELRERVRGAQKFQRLGNEPVESVGRLRLARRGKVVFFLYGADSTAAFRLIGQSEVGDEDISLGAIQLLAHTGGKDRETQVVWKRFTARAATVTAPGGDDPAN